MRIGIEVQRLFRAEKHGIEQSSLAIIRQLQKLDLVNEYYILVRKDIDYTCLEETENFKVIANQASSFPEWEQIKLPKMAKKLKLDILHCTGNTAPLKLKVPLVLTLHDIIFMEKLSRGGSAYQYFGNLYRRWIAPAILKKAQKIITVSQKEKEIIQEKFKLREEKIEIIYNGLEPKFRLIEDRELLHSIKKKYELPDSFILFIGNEAPKKNGNRVIEAFANFHHQNNSDTALVLPNFPERSVKHILKKLGLAYILPKFVFTPYLRHEDLLVVYNLAMALMFPSLRESFGMPIIEAMACGTPVITSHLSAMPEIAGDAALLVNPYDIDEIKSSIVQLHNNPGLYDKMVKKGVIHAQHFSWRQSAQKLLAVYASCLR